MQRFSPRWILFSFFAMCLVCVFSLLALSVYWIYDAKLGKVVDFVREREESAAPQNFELESHSLVNTVDFEAFYLFSNEAEAFKDWLEEKRISHSLTLLPDSKKPSEIVFNESLMLAGLRPNSCEQIYCYQIRENFLNFPPNILRALMGIEDYRYLNHKGIDLKSILRALIIDIKEMKLVQGGSTITQQLVKNLLLSSEKTIERKLKEMVFSIYFESHLSKEQIIQIYLNEVYWGTVQGLKIKGFYAASLFYFHKRPNELTGFEVSVLISLLKGPNYYNPIRRLERLRKRVEVVYKKLLQLNLLSFDEADVWEESDWRQWHKSLLQRQKNRRARAIWRAEKENGFFLSSYERYVLSRSRKKVLLELGKKVGNSDFGVKVLLTRPFCRSNCPPDYAYYSKYERDLSAAMTGERHQVGSILKPIIYNIFLQNGWNLADNINAGPISLKLKSGSWSPREAGRPKESELTLLQAILRSRNRPLIRLANEFGFAALQEQLLELIPRLKTPLSEYPAQLLGSVELSLKEILHLYRRFVHSECNSLLLDETSGGKSWEETLLYHLSDPTLGTVRRVVDERLSSLRFFGKTGTSNQGFDNWYVFFDGSWLGIFYFGFEGDRSKKSFRLSGSGTAFRMFQEFIKYRGKRMVEFSCPQDL